MANFAISHLLLTYASGASAYAFEVLQEGYQGDDESYARDISRNISGDMVIVEAANSHREFRGNVILDYDASGTVEYGSTYTLGTDVHLKACLEATDLTCKSFDDSAPWNAQWVGNWAPRLVYDPTGDLRVMQVHLVQR